MTETKEYDKVESTNNSTSLDHEDLNTINSFKSKEYNNVVHYNKTLEDLDSPLVERVKFKGITDDDSNYLEESEDVKLPPIPDGGWGWVVVLSAFLVSACVGGLTYSFGLLQKEFVLYFEVYQYQASMVGSVFIATPLLAGPIMGALVDRYGCRVMTIIAGLVSTLGFLLAAISNSIQVLCLTFGFISGLAMGVLYVTSVVSVAFWFEKRRNFAVSLALCGIGFGTLIYSPLTNYLLEEYGWRYTLLLLAGTLFNMCVCGAVMRDPEWLEIKHRRERRLSKSRSKKSSIAGSLSSIGKDSIYLNKDELKSLLKSGNSPDHILETLATTIAEAKELKASKHLNTELNIKRMHSAVHLPTVIQDNEKVPIEVIEKLIENKRLYNIILQNYPDLVTIRRSKPDLNEDPPPDAVAEPVKLPLNERWYHRVLKTLKATFDMRMFTEFHFIMFNVSCALLSIWCIVPYYYLKDFMDAQPLEGGEMMISVIGIASSVGIVSLGWAGDQPWINITKAYAVCLIVCGVSVFIYPLFITNYWALIIISAVFGLSFASSYSYTPTILMELVSIDRFTVALGLVLLTQGIGHLVGPPIASMLFDLTGTWNLTFYMGGAWLCASGVCIGVIPYIQNVRVCGSTPLLKKANDADGVVHDPV